MLFDTHTHYTDPRFDEDRDEILQKMQSENVGRILNSCSSTEEIPQILELCEKYPFIYCSVGVHPHEVKDMCNDDIETLFEYTNHEKVLAIGEIGLDYYYDLSPRELQKYWFARQIQLAKEVNLPVIIHDRDAHKDTLDILKSENVRDCGGVFHCYSGSSEMVKEVLDLNMYLAFGGSVTFKNAKKTQEAASAVPLDRLLIETDCPYLTPEPHRGKRNSSLYIKHVCEKLAEIKGISYNEIVRITEENAKKLFRIKD